MWFPDNDNRANRLQQLIDSISDKQSSVIHYQQTIDSLNTAVQPILTDALKAQGYTDLLTVISTNMDLLSPTQGGQYATLIESAKQIAPTFDWDSFAGALMVLVAGQNQTPASIIGIGKFTVRTAAVYTLGLFLSASGSAEAQDASALIMTSDDTRAIIAKSIDIGGDVVKDIGELIEGASLAAARISSALSFLSTLGFVTSVILEIVDIVEEAKQKEELISAIHNAQPARLCMAFFQTEGNYIVQQLQLSQTLLLALANTSNPSSGAAAQALGTYLITQMTTPTTSADWTALEVQLEAQDKTSSLYYGNDNLPTAEVVQLATSTPSS